MVKKIIWITAILSLMLNASTERKGFEKKEYIQCFDGQPSFITYKNHLFYSSQNNKFLTKENASKDSCKKQYLKTKKHAIVCTLKRDVLKTIKNLQKNKQRLLPSCLVPKETLQLVVSSHIYNKLSYFHISYLGHDLFIPKSSLELIPEIRSKYTKEYAYKSKEYKHYKRKHTRKKHTRKKHYKRKHTTRKHTTKKHYKRKHTIRKHTTKKHTTKKHTTRKPNTRTSNKQKTITHHNHSYTYKCIGNHGNVNISATDDNSMNMASNILWRMCQRLKTEDEVCKIRDCYKLIR